VELARVSLKETLGACASPQSLLSSGSSRRVGDVSLPIAAGHDLHCHKRKLGFLRLLCDYSSHGYLTFSRSGFVTFNHTYPSTLKLLNLIPSINSRHFGKKKCPW
jgi:hypothetical protein